MNTHMAQTRACLAPDHPGSGRSLSGWRRTDGVCTITRMAKMKERWDFRVEPEADRLVRQAAAASQRTLTEFVVDAAVLEAERLLADRTTFALPPEQWKQFVALLDRSPRDNPGLEKLFSQPSVFSGG